MRSFVNKGQNNKSNNMSEILGGGAPPRTSTATPTKTIVAPAEPMTEVRQSMQSENMNNLPRNLTIQPPENNYPVTPERKQPAARKKTTNYISGHKFAPARSTVYSQSAKSNTRTPPPV